MNFKLCFEQQIHRCPKTPEDFEGLRAAVKQTFKDVLPKNFGLSYIDQDGDRVMLTSEDDFKLMVQMFSQQEGKSIKIYVFEDAERKDLAHGSYQMLSDEHEQRGGLPEGEEKKKIVYPEFLEEKKLEEPKPESHQNQPHEMKQVNMLLDKSNERIDLSDPKALRAFIIQTIEETLPQILANSLKQNVVQQKKTIEQYPVVQGIKNVANDITTKIEKLIIGEREGLNAKVSRTDKIVPEKIYTTDEQIQVVLAVKNNGTVPFPANTFLQHVGGVEGNTIMLPPMESRNEYTTAILLKNPKKAGNYISKWRFGWVNGQEQGQFFGEEYEVKFTVNEKKYSKDVQQKATQLKEFIPQFEIGTFLEFVSKNPKYPVEVLMDMFISENNI